MNKDNKQVIEDFANELLQFLNEENWGTPDERWRPESEFGLMVKAVKSRMEEG